MAEITCCTGQTECNHLVTVGYLKSFIGTNIKDTGGTTVYVNTTKPDSYVPTYAELTNNGFIQQYVDGGTNKWHSSIDGITVNGTYSSNQGVEQSDLVLTYFRFKSLSISAGKTTFDECSDSTDITATYKLTKTVKAMNNCVAAESSSEGSDTTCKPSFSGSCNWLTLGSCSSNKITASAGKNGDWSAPQRSCSVKTTVTYKGQTYTSNTITITQEALTGSYSVYEGRHYTATTITSHDDLTQNTCSGATVTASATAYYYDRYKWKDSCGKVYEYNYDDRYSSESAGSASHTFDPVYCPTESQTDTYVMTITYQSHSDSVTFYQVCSQPCEACEDFNTYGSCNVTEYVDACGGDVTLSCSMPTTIHHKGWDGMGHCIETGTTETAYTQTAVVTIPENKIQGGPGATSSHTGSITTEEGGVINYTIIQDISNPCGGCGEEFSSFTFSDVSVNCSAHTNEQVSVPFTLTKSYSVTACADVQESGFSAYTININSCNEATSVKDFVSGGSLGNFTIHQAAGNGTCCCSCNDFSLASSQLVWTTYSDVATRSNAYTAGNCITDITATSDNNWFTVSVSSGNINVTPSGQNTTTSDKTATITVNTKVNGSSCSPKTFTVKQPAYGCTCNDLTVSTTSLSWSSWNDTAAKTATYTANTTCISNVTVTSDTAWFTVTNSNGTLTITPSGNNTTLTAKTGVITINYESNGSPCYKNISVSQPAYGCTCNDLTLGSAPSAWAWNESAAKTVSYTSNTTCISNINITSSNNWFTVTSTSSSITVKPSGNNDSTAPKTATITVSYDSVGTAGCSKTFEVTQNAYGCTCDDLTVNTTPSAWNWDDTSSKTATYSFKSDCISDINIEVTGSSSTRFTVTSATTTSSGTITITPKQTNTGITSYTATVVINYKSNGETCRKTFLITQKPDACSCEDMTVTPSTSTIPASGSSALQLATFTVGRNCFDTFNVSDDANWLEVYPIQTGSDVIGASVNSNSTCESRTATITFKYGSGGTTSCTTSFTVTQEARSCSCSDITFNVTKTSLDCGGATNQQIGTYAFNCATCSKSSLSKGGTFSNLTVTFDNGIIYATYPATTSAKSGTLILRYANSDCQTVTLTQNKCCTCDDLTVNTTPSAWNWDDTSSKTATYSFVSSCISDINIEVTGSSSTRFTVTNSTSTASGTITITPKQTNTGITSYIATVVINYKSNGETCRKTFLITQKPDACDCADLILSPMSGAIPASGGSEGVKIASFTFPSGREQCFDTFNISADASWLGLYPVIGNNHEIGAFPSANNTCNVRTANVTLNYGSGGTTSCTTAFTVTQEPRDCACSDVTFNVTKTVLDCGGATNQQIGTYTLGCPNCSRSLLSKGGTFNQLTITFEDGKILATYPAAVGIKSGTLILKYNGNTCTTVSMSQRECCDCSNFTISPTAATWAYNVTTTSSLTISSGICISDITLSSLSHFTATKGNAVITVKPNSNNTGSSVIQETLTVSYKADGTKCTSKTIKLIHNPKNCDCSDLTITQTS